MPSRPISKQELAEKLSETQIQLEERIKELQCLYDMANLIEDAENRPEVLLAGMPPILCRSWQYPEITCARVTYRGLDHRSPNYRRPKWKQTEALTINGVNAGMVEVGYLRKMPDLDEGPFLKEERDLIKAVAERLGHVLERWENQQELDESRAMFQRLADNAQDMIYRMSLPDGAYVFVNRAAEQVFGYPAERFYQNPMLVRDVIHPDFQGYLAEEWEKLIAGRMSPSYEYKIVDPQGNERWLHQRNVLVRDEGGNPVAIEGIVTDITERKRLIERLEHSTDELDRQVKQRTAQLNHELEESKRREAVIKAQNQEILDLSSPVLRIADNILLTPLIGTLDSERTRRFADVLLDSIVSTQAEVAMIDITGTPSIDTQTAQHLIDTISAVKLLGCGVVITGVRPAIAQTLVQLGIDLSGIRTVSRLSQGLEEVLGQAKDARP